MKSRPILLLCLLMSGAVAHASAQLKPTTGATQALRAKNLDVSAEVNGAFATSTVTTTYDNPNPERIEADFIYSAPPGAIVTGFAYWYEGEKVIARVVEKERAAQIYQYITSRMRDPALVEMIGKNTFRARIFPVEPRKDLKIEVKLAQQLAPTTAGWKWSFPLRGETADAPLDNLTMKVKIAGARRASSNVYGTIAVNSPLVVKRENFTAKEDIRVELLNGQSPSRVEFYSARDGGSDGFFALAIANAKSASAPQIAGVKTYDVSAVREKNGALYVFGRYRGSGNATVKAGGQIVPLNFAAGAEKPNVASLLWAANRIETLSAREGNHDAVVSLSKRFGMPSKWTSWLAIPLAERENFKKQILASDRESAARAYAQAVARGDKGAVAREKKRVAQVTKELVAVGEDYSSEEERQPLASYLDQELKNVRRAQTQAKYQQVSRAKMAALKRSERNLRRAGAKGDGAGVEMPVYLLEDELRIASRLYAGEVANGRGQGARAKGLQARLKELSRTKVARNYGWDENTFMSEQVSARTQDLALEIAVNKFSAKPSASFQAQKTTQLERLTKRFGGNAKSAIQNAVATAAVPRASQLASQIAAQEARGEKVSGRPRLTELAKLAGQTPDALLKSARTERVRQSYNSATDDLVSEVLAGREDTEKARGLQKQVEEFKRDSDDWWQKDAVQRAYNGRSHELAYEIETERAKAAPDEKRIANLEAQLNETASKTTSNSFGYLDWQKRRVAEKQGPVNPEDYRYRVAGLDPNDFHGGYGGGDPLLQISAPADARSVIAIMPNGEIKPLEWRAATKRWEANFDIPMDTRADSYLVTIVIVDKNGQRRTLKLRYRVDDQAPKGDAKIQLNTGASGGKLQLEVSASDDTTRVVALLPWGERLVLRRAQNGAFASQVELPATWDKPSVPVRFILIDRAHNRTELNVDWNP